jgi:uncharacterized protein (TIGR00369 family)
LGEHELPMKTVSALTVDNNRCFACGTENEAGLRLRFTYGDDERTAETRFMPDASYQGWKDLVHGGILMTLMDETMAKAAVHSGLSIVTAEMTSKFKSPARVGTLLICSAKIEDIRKRLVYARASIRNEDGSVIAEATGKLMIT